MSEKLTLSFAFEGSGGEGETVRKSTAAFTIEAPGDTTIHDRATTLMDMMIAMNGDTDLAVIIMAKAMSLVADVIDEHSVVRAVVDAAVDYDSNARRQDRELASMGVTLPK